MDLTQAFYDRLTDATLVGMLATYRGAPAIFTVDHVPTDAALPFVVTPGEIAGTPFDTKTSQGRDILRDIGCYTEDNGSVAAVEAIAERVRVLFHRHRLTVAGGHTMIASADPPMKAPTEDGINGRIVQVRLVVMDA
jgi:hypothetical protein